VNERPNNQFDVLVEFDSWILDETCRAYNEIVPGRKLMSGTFDTSFIQKRRIFMKKSIAASPSTMHISLLFPASPACLFIRREAALAQRDTDRMNLLSALNLHSVWQMHQLWQVLQLPARRSNIAECDAIYRIYYIYRLIILISRAPPS